MALVRLDRSNCKGQVVQYMHKGKVCSHVLLSIATGIKVGKTIFDQFDVFFCRLGHFLVICSTVSASRCLTGCSLALAGR